MKLCRKFILCLLYLILSGCLFYFIVFFVRNKVILKRFKILIKFRNYNIFKVKENIEEYFIIIFIYFVYIILFEFLENRYLFLDYFCFSIFKLIIY